MVFIPIVFEQNRSVNKKVMICFKTENVHEELQLLIKFYKNKNTAQDVNLLFAN